MTHSVYTLQKQREEAKYHRDKLAQSLKAQQDTTRRYEEENEEFMEDVARKVVLQQEIEMKTRLVIQDCDDAVRKRRERREVVERSEGKVMAFRRAMSRLEALVQDSHFLQKTSLHLSPSDIIHHYNELAMQSNSLNSRYVTLTETEGALISKLKTLKEELKVISRNAAEDQTLPVTLLRSSIGATQTDIRVRIEEKAENNEIDRVQRVELMYIFSFLYFQESKNKLRGTLTKLYSHVQENYLLPQWQSLSRLDTYTWTEDSLNMPSRLRVLNRICMDLPILRLVLTPKDTKNALGDGNSALAEVLEALMEAATVRFNERFGRLMTDIMEVLGTLIRETEKVETDVDLLQLSPEQQSRYENMELDAVKGLPTQVNRVNRRKLSCVVRGILEYKLKQASNSPLQELKSDFHNYMSTFYRLPQRPDTAQSEFGKTLGVEDSSNSEELQDGDISKLLRHTEPDQPKAKAKAREKQAKRFDFTTRSYERVVLSEVAKTESKIKEVIEKSMFYSERLTLKKEAALQSQETLGTSRAKTTRLPKNRLN